MKIRIKFDDDDATAMTEVKFYGACENQDELASTLISLTDHRFENVLASLIGFSGDADRLRGAIAILEGKELSDGDA